MKVNSSVFVGSEGAIEPTYCLDMDFNLIRRSDGFASNLIPYSVEKVELAEVNHYMPAFSNSVGTVLDFISINIKAKEFGLIGSELLPLAYPENKIRYYWARFVLGDPIEINEVITGICDNYIASKSISDFDFEYLELSNIVPVQVRNILVLSASNCSISANADTGEIKSYHTAPYKLISIDEIKKKLV